MVQEVVDAFVAVAVDTKEFHGIIRMNKTGKYIFELLQNEISKEEIVSKLEEKYDVKEVEIDKMVQEFIKSLQLFL